MKKHDPSGSIVANGAFFNKAVSARLAGTLSEEERREYEARAVAELGEECARWLATGKGLD